MAEEAPKTVLTEADILVYGDRQSEYGHPRDNFAIIARFWNDYLVARKLLPKTDVDRRVDAADVSQMMALLKIARYATGSPKRDTLIDEAGYAGLTARILGWDA